jgi:D-alanyl-D-alanine carboxypeptidase
MSIRTRALAAGLLLTIAAAPAIAADPSASPVSSPSGTWSGPALTTTPMSAADAAVIDGYVTDAMTQFPDLPGMWIGVWDPEKGYYEQAYGEAVKGGEKAAIDQHGRIGSVTKTFTVAAILQQVAAGDLALDSTIADVLPDLAAKYPDIAAITIEQLAGMTSGIPDYANTGITTKIVVDDPQHVFTADELIGAGMSLPLSPPGTGGYSTTSTIILGQMLEKLTGKPVEQVVTELAASLGLTQTALQAPDQTLMPDPASHGYVPNDAAAKTLGLDVKGGTDVTDWTPSWGQAGGGMYSTIADMGTWAGTGLGTSLLPADLAAKRFETKPIPEAPSGYGLGLIDYGKGWVGHTGQIIGWESIVLYNTETGGAFVGIVNGNESLAAAEVVAAQALPDLVQLFMG